MTLEDVKNYLRIDDDADDPLILMLIETAKTEIAAAVGRFAEEDERMVMLLYATVQDMYDHRELIQSNQRQKLGSVFRSIVTQLQLDYGDEEGGTDG